MKKDIFIDTNIAKNFANPMDKSYKQLVEWLAKYDNRLANNDADDAAFLVLSHKLLKEYIDGNKNAYAATNIVALVDKLTRENRLHRFNKQQIIAFKQAHYSKSFLKKFNKLDKDLDHIPIICLSDRQFALTNDTLLTTALQQITGFSPTISNRPEKLPYNK